jgi:hypothetical protein
MYVPKNLKCALHVCNLNLDVYNMYTTSKQQEHFPAPRTIQQSCNTMHQCGAIQRSVHNVHRNSRAL